MDLDILPDTLETREHWWWRPGWRLGRQMHTMHLTLQNSPGAEATIRHVQDSLAGVDAVRPVPIEGLHLTMTGVGFTDEVTTAQLDEVAEQVFARAEDLEVAPLEAVEVERPTLTLMRLGRDRRVYEWDVVRELPLGR